MSESSQPSPRQPVNPGRPERRESLRFSPAEGETFRHLRAVVDGCSGDGLVRNYSAGGISLVFDRRIEPAAVVNLQLHNTDTNYSRKLVLSVVYLQERPNGRWILGGSFTRKLNLDELQALLAEST